MQIETVDPTRDPGWEAFITDRPEATPFHTGAWAKVLRDTYNFEPRYMIARAESGKVEAGAPLFAVGGQRLVGVPFSDYCAPLIPDSAGGHALVEQLKLTATNGTKGLELRGPAVLDLSSEGFSKVDGFVQHTIMLDASLPEIESRFRGSVRRAIRKARRNGLTVRAADSLDDMQLFYNLNILTRRKHGLIPQPWRFFENIHRHMISGGSGLLLLCEHEGTVIAADLLLAQGTKLVNKFNASNATFQSLNPNNLLLMTAIELGVSEGYTELNLGRTEIDQEGLRRFKLGWGSREEPLPYYYYPQGQQGSWSSGNTPPGQRLMALFVRVAPSWALRMAGAAIYKRAA